MSELPDQRDEMPGTVKLRAPCCGRELRGATLMLVATTNVRRMRWLETVRTVLGMDTTVIDGFPIGPYAARSIRSRAVRAALNLFAYEACPYNRTQPSRLWVAVLPGLVRAGKLELASAVAARIMNGRDEPPGKLAVGSQQIRRQS